MRPLVSLLAIVLCAAACTASVREKTLHASLLTLNAARDGFIAYDRATEREILDRSPDRATFEPAIAAYRRRSDIVVRGFEAAYQALAIAALSNEPKTLATALAAAAAARDLYEILKRGME